MLVTDELRNKINDLYDECLENFKQFHKKIDMFEMPELLVLRIKEETNIDLLGF